MSVPRSGLIVHVPLVGHFWELGLVFCLSPVNLARIRMLSPNHSITMLLGDYIGLAVCSVPI